MKFHSLLLAASLFSGSSASYGDAPPIIEKLNRVDATWHKHSLFSTAMEVREPEEYATTLNWFKSKVMGDMPDSRYAMTYSMMLWRTGDQRVAETAYMSAVFGYAALQLESARCDNRQESIQIARTWYDMVRSQLASLRNVPSERRKQIFMSSLAILKTYSPDSMQRVKQSSLWMCYSSPSYVNSIMKLPDTVKEVFNGPNGRTTVFLSHPSMQPDLASQDEFDKRRQAIMNDMSKIVLGTE